MAEGGDFQQNGDWVQYRRMIMSALERLEGQMESLSEKIDTRDGSRSREIADLRVAVGMLQAKTVIYGVVASIVATALLNFLLRAH